MHERAALHRTVRPATPPDLMIRFLSLALLAAALPLAASAQPAPRAMPGVPARIAALAGRLDLAPDQRARLDAVAARYAGQTDAAALWAASADLQSVLTPEQTAALAARRTERRAAPRDGARRARPERRAARPERRARPGAQRDPATAERRAAVQTIRTEFAPRAEALRTSLRAGQLTPAQFAEQSRALRAEAMQRLDATRTPEQRQRAEQMRARRDAAKAARVRALSLTAEQQRALDGLAAERLAERARTAPVRTAPDRGAARPDAAQRQQRGDAMRAERDAMRTRAAAILTPQQAATESIHAALAHSGRPDGGARRGARGAGRRGRN